MGTHNISDAQGTLPELIERALRGEPVVITRNGQPVIEFRPISGSDPGPITAADLELLDRLRVRPRRALPEDSGSLLGRIQDEDWP